MFFNEKLNEFRNSAFKLVLPSKEISRREGFHRGILESLHGAVIRKKKVSVGLFSRIHGHRGVFSQVREPVRLSGDGCVKSRYNS